MIKPMIEKHLRYGLYFRRELAKVHEQRNWSVDQQRKEQEAQLITLIQKSYRNSLFYNRLYRACKIDMDKIRKIQDLERLPIISSKDVKASAQDIFVGNKLNKLTAHTSGTTGSPMNVYRNYQSVVKEGAYIWAHRRTYGYNFGMKTVTLRGNLGKDQMEYFDRFTNTLYLSSYNLSPENAEWYYDRIASFKPKTILAYPSSLETLANYFRAMDKSLSIPMAFTSSETLYSYQREKIEDIFQTNLVDWYGNAERTIALEQNKEGFYDELPLYSVNEFYSDHAITTGLINWSFPLIRYRVDDTFIPKTDRNSDVDVVERVQGRSYDYLVLPDGSRVGLLCCAIKGIDNLEYVQIIQEDPSSFTVNYVPTQNFTEQNQNHLIANIRDKVGADACFEVKRITEDQIIRAKSGKFKMIHKLHNETGNRSSVITPEYA